MDNFKSMAVLIDADNVSHKIISTILDELKTNGKIVIKRAYGNIEKLKEWKDACIKNAIAISAHFNNVKGKNVTDSYLIIDAMNILYTSTVDTFVIISSDSDYTGLVIKLKELGKETIVIGNSKTPKSLKNACDIFKLIDNLQDENATTSQKSSDKKGDELSEIHKFIVDLISSSNEPMNLSAINEKLKTSYPDFDIKTYRNKNFSVFMKKVPDITVRTLDDKTTMVAELIDTNKKTEISPTLEELKLFIDKELDDLKGHNISELRIKIKQKYPKFNIKNYSSKFIKLLSMLDLNLQFTPKNKPVHVKKVK